MQRFFRRDNQKLAYDGPQSEVDKLLADGWTEAANLDPSLDELKAGARGRSDALTQMRDDLNQMRDDLKAVKEIIIAWNNIRGFVQTVKALNSTLWFLTKTIAIIAAIAGAVYMFGKTGHWIWPVDRNGQ